ncbi:MAG: M23 family metallopeptidase [Microthrixaceae bacterium]
MRSLRRRYVRAALVVGLAAALAPTAPANATHGTNEKIEISAPFSGTVTSAAGAHSPSFGGDWATDLAATPGTPVRFRWGQSTGVVSGRVAFVGAACPSGNVNEGGYRVRIDVTVDGVVVGSINYAHVSPFVAVNNVLGNGAQIGVIGGYAFSSCWTSPHVHIEPDQNAEFSCYSPLGGGIGEGTRIGVLGGQVHTSPNQACTSTDYNFIPDTTPPLISASVSPTPNPGGWNRSSVTVTWFCSDASGIASCTGPTTVSTETPGTVITGIARDNAGNTRTVTVTVRLDTTAPALSAAFATQPNANGWYNSPVTIDWACSDVLSGLAADCSAETVSTEGAGLTRSRTVVDRADNSTSLTTPAFSIDLSGPVVTHTRNLDPNSADWYSQPVTVAWACNDDLSGLDGDCPSPTVLNTEGAGQTAEVTVLDLAGNSTAATDGPINIDFTAPDVTMDPSPVAGTTVTGTAADALSGISTVNVTITNLLTLASTTRRAFLSDGVWTLDLTGVSSGPSTLTAIATDRAGNQRQTAPQVTIITTAV